jgi:hypothetical protein
LISGPTASFKGVELLGPIDTILEVVAVIVALLVGARLGFLSGKAAVGLIQGAIGFARRRRTPDPVREPPAWPADWPLTLTLLVRVDEGEGVLHPSVQVRGPSEPRSGRIRLELVDPDGAVRLTVKRLFPAEALNTELPLPGFAPPDGASVDQVLRWRWDIVLSGERSELRWRERPVPAEGLNPEAELLRGGERAPAEPLRRRFAGEAANELDLAGARRRAVLRKRAARLLLALALVAYIIVVYSGPTGEVSAFRAVLLYGAFAAMWIALWAFSTALFASDEEIAPDSRTDA